jgi:DNA-binding transcriptional MerR regulator
VIFDTGHSAPEVAKLTGATYRQLDYWDNTGIVRPSIRPAEGSGTTRRYSDDDVARIRAVMLLLECGVSLAAIRRVMQEEPAVAAEILARLAEQILGARSLLPPPRLEEVS